MIPALNDLVSSLELHIPVLACHQHFLADVGKDLLVCAHGQLRALFRRHKVRPRLGLLIRDLGRELGTDIKQARGAVIKWQTLVDPEQLIISGRDGLAVVRALAQWVLDFKAQATGLDFPFDRPYLDLYDRCAMTLQATETFLRSPPADKVVTRALKRLNRYLQPVGSDVPFRQVTKTLRRRAALFDELRGVLRIVSAAPKDETVMGLEQIRADLDKWIARLKDRRSALGPERDMRKAIDVIVAHIETHGDSLWGHAIRLPDGSVRLVSRTNNLAEHFFGSLKHEERRRSGYKNLGRVLENLPAHATLVRNLEHDDYVFAVCGTLGRLPTAFAELDCQERQNGLNGLVRQTSDDALHATLQISSASLSTEDRRVVRTQAMGRRIAAAAATCASQ